MLVGAHGPQRDRTRRRDQLTLAEENQLFLPSTVSLLAIRRAVRIVLHFETFRLSLQVFADVLHSFFSCSVLRPAMGSDDQLPHI